MSVHSRQDHTFWPPGTVLIQDQELSGNHLKLQPTPSADLNDPLNWSTLRKSVNFSLVCLYTLSTFILLDIGTVIWAPVHSELGISYSSFNLSFASNTAGLALGCILLVPLAIKFGRRPIYLFSVSVQFACAIWQARVRKTWELIAVNALQGAVGSISEAMVQMTVADLYFVHQRGGMNAIYLCCVVTGANLSPVAAGYIAVKQGWRWIWWWTAVLLGVSVLGFLFFFEESKYVMPIEGRGRGYQMDELLVTQQSDGKEQSSSSQFSTPEHSEAPPIPKKSYRQRLALITPTFTPILPRMYSPFIILFTFPAVAYTALQYGSLLAWISIIITAISTYMSAPPYNFTSAGVGLMNIPPFIGAVIGSVVGGPLNDWVILRLARRNEGVYEPEMRLWGVVLGVLACPAGLLVFGLGLAQSAPWIVLAVGSGIFGFAFGCTGDISLTYLTDCYRDITGDAFVAVVFVRNAFATAIVFALNPWISKLGLYNMFVCAACLGLSIGLLTVPMIIWGKKARNLTAMRYKMLADGQPGKRDV